MVVSTSLKKRMIFGWSIILSLVTVTYARAISVSNAPSLMATRNTTTKRRLPPTTNTLLLAAAAAAGRRSSSSLLTTTTTQNERGIRPSSSINDDDDDENLDDVDALLLESCGFTARGGAAAVAAKTTEKAWVEGAKNSLASALAAAFSKTILAPLDTVKTLQQYHQTTSSSMHSLTLLEAARTIVARPGGFLNFYAGLGVSVLGAMPSVAMYFGTYSYCKKALSRPRTRADGSTYVLSRSFVVGASAAIGNTLASFSRVPYEVLKQKLQTNTYRTTLEAVRDITSWDMIFPKGGVAIQMMRDIPYAVVTLLLYEHLQAWSIQQKKQQQQLASKGRPRSTKNGSQEIQQASSDMLLGAVSGGMGSWVTNPLDVIKTRLQTAPFEVYQGSITRCATETWKEGGGMAFLRGSWPRLMHKIPANGFFFLFYEFFRRALKCQGYE